MALFTNELLVGEILIVSDPFPAIPGMAVKPKQDESMLDVIRSWVEAQQ